MIDHWLCERERVRAECVDEWMVSILFGVWNGGGGAAAVLPGAVVWLVPYSSHCSAGEYCCHSAHCYLLGVWCGAGECVSVVFVW